MGLRVHGPICVDAEDQPLLLRWKWKRSGYGYVCRSVETREKAGTVYLHILIAEPSGKQRVDHVNGDVLDNRRSNLRVCSHAENNLNRRLATNNTTGYKGVVFVPHLKSKPFMAQIQHLGKNIYLKHHASREEAARAYDAKAKELFGEYALLNFP